MTQTRAARVRRPEPDGSVLRWPGATSKFALFAEVLWTGVLVTVSGLLIVTLPAALAAGTRHLRRYLAAEDSHARLFWADFAAAVRGGAVVGAIAGVVSLVLWIDVVLAASGVLPGGQIVLVVAIVGWVAIATILLQSTVLWSPGVGWRAALRLAPRSLRNDLVGAAYLVSALGIAAVVTWQLPPLFLPALGCLAFAAVAVSVRDVARRSR